jgi:hypothetical protein
MAALKDANIIANTDLTSTTVGSGSSTTGWKAVTSLTTVPKTSFNINAGKTEADLSDFMNKLLEIEERLNSWSCGEIEVEDDTPSAGYATLKYYSDEATPTLYKTIVVVKATGARSQAT